MDQLSRQGNQTLSLQDIVFITALTFTTYLGQLVLQQFELERSRTVYKLEDDQECGITGGDNYRVSQKNGDKILLGRRST